MSGETTAAGMRSCLTEVVGEFAAREFDRMLADAEMRGSERAWTEALRWVRQYAENTSPEMAIQHIDRAEPFNPYRAATPEPTP